MDGKLVVRLVAADNIIGRNETVPAVRSALQRGYRRTTKGGDTTAAAAAAAAEGTPQQLQLRRGGGVGGAHAVGWPQMTNRRSS